MLISISINIFMLILTLIKFIKSSMVSYRASYAILYHWKYAIYSILSIFYTKRENKIIIRIH